MKKGDTVKFKKEVDSGDKDLIMTLLEDPDGGRVLVREEVNMAIKPTNVFNVEDLEILNRIPEVKNDSIEAMQDWFNEMKEKGLLFHPDDDPREIVSLIDVKLGSIFTEEESNLLDGIIDSFFRIHGEAVYDAGLKATGIE